MANQNRPQSPQHSPDPARAYERAHPATEAGAGRLDNNMDATPAAHADAGDHGVENAHDPRQINAHDDPGGTGGSGQPSSHVQLTGKTQRDDFPRPQPDHSMLEEDGLDEYPVDITDPQQRRHPRTEGKGGVR